MSNDMHGKVKFQVRMLEGYMIIIKEKIYLTTSEIRIFKFAVFKILILRRA